MTPRFHATGALVTGAAQGIGKAIAAQLLTEGSGVVLFDMKAEVLSSAASELGALGQVVAVAGDTSVRGDVRAAVATAVERFGGLDILIVNAGIAEVRSLLDIDDAAWNRMIAINLTGVYIALQEGGREMVRARKGGAIVVTASTNAFFPEQHTAHYSAAKGGVVALVKSAALDLAEHGIRVNAISPGVIRTPLAAPLVDDPGSASDFLKSVPMRRFGEPEEIARVVAFLASRDASFITGENLVIDGGTTVGTTIPIKDMELPGFAAAPHKRS